MSDDTYEVAFQGEIADGADLEQVKAAVGQMFKADAAKLAHLFSGKRVVIKKGIDHATAMKYQAALNKAGALCEVKNLSALVVEQAPAPSPPSQTEVSATGNLKATAPEIDAEIPPAPETDPLHITANDIDDIAASIAPVGTDMQMSYQAVDEPQVDISGLDMAPVGSDMSDKKEEEVPPLPDTEGLKIID